MCQLQPYGVKQYWSLPAASTVSSGYQFLLSGFGYSEADCLTERKRLVESVTVLLMEGHLLLRWPHFQL